jgi:hypothetical protein
MRTNRIGDDRAARKVLYGRCAMPLAMATVVLGAAGCASPPNGSGRLGPDVAPVLKPMCDVLDGAKTYRFRVSADMDEPTGTGQLAQFHRTSEITVAKPDRLYEKTDADEGSWSAWYSGKKLVVLARDSNTYATEAVPGRIDRMLDYMADKYDLVMPMADLLAGRTYKSLLANVESSRYVGLHSVGDTQCHHLLMHQENIDWQIWIDAGKLPLPRKLVITYKQTPGQPQYVATMDHWDLSPTISKDTFKFTPPADSKAVSMADLVNQERGEQP